MKRSLNLNHYQKDNVKIHPYSTSAQLDGTDSMRWKLRILTSSVGQRLRQALVQIDRPSPSVASLLGFRR